MPVTYLTRIGPDEGGNFEYRWEGAYVQAYMLSDVGKKREHNEDACMISVPKYATKGSIKGMIFAVADGMGGASAGEHASRVTLEALAEALAAEPEETIPVFMHKAVTTANRRVFEEATTYPEYQGMGTTISAVLIIGDRVYVAQVGDSRVYLARRRRLHQITSDHSVVAEQVRNGLLTEEEARTHSLKNLITRAVGIKDTVKIDLFSTQIRQGDTLLVCSDGLSNLVKDAEVQEILTHRKIEDAARKLVDRALEEGGTDNITVLLTRITCHPRHVPLEEGAQEIKLPGGGLLGGLFG